MPRTQRKGGRRVTLAVDAWAGQVSGEAASSQGLAVPHSARTRYSVVPGLRGLWGGATVPPERAPHGVRQATGPLGRG